jgi:hypothetical protein
MKEKRRSSSDASPHKSLSRDGLVACTQRDLEFVSAQVMRFLHMSPETLIAHVRKNPNDGLCTIPHPTGSGSLICGTEAWLKFGSIASTLEQFDPSLLKRVDRDRLNRIVIDAYVQKVLMKGDEIDEASARIVVEYALQMAKESLSTIEHYLPCISFKYGGPDQFNIGPVSFVRTRTFLRSKRIAFRESAMANAVKQNGLLAELLSVRFNLGEAVSNDDAETLARNLLAEAIRSYRRYPWVAIVTIVDCDRRVSREVARRTAETSLNVIRLILGARYTERVRLAWGRGDPFKTAGLWTDSAGVLHAETASQSLWPVGAENWHDALVQSDYEVGVCGSAISALVSASEISELHARLVDALNWFGDAATDTEATASIVKYVSAIERLLFGEYKTGRTAAFARRVKLIVGEFGWDGATEAYEDALNMYNIRSSLVHGSSSPRDQQAKRLLRMAHDLARKCVLSATQLYPLIVSVVGGHPTAGDLELIMAQLEKTGLEPLLKRADSTAGRGAGTRRSTA